ncbi:MAG: hypothetical protein QOH31_989 [Verrucomicrobiota bacterium]
MARRSTRRRSNRHTFAGKASAKRSAKALKKAVTTRRPTKTSKDASAMKGHLASEAPLEEPVVELERVVPQGRPLSKRKATLISEAGNSPAPATVCTTSR